MAPACSALPLGRAVDQLWNFCGRAWEILHTPTYAELERMAVGEVDGHPELSRLFAEKIDGAIYATLTGIIERGIADGQLRPIAPRAAARVLLAALAKQASWCNQADAFGSPMGGGCNRVVADSLSILLGGLQLSQPDTTS
ncbi:MAG TPA: TetR/AcrR family transcriptional regulator C-terminal domain-containing protein [Gemmatimonadales bacterium]|nr:TetR/AcrR family transcriptional regulator C-terminal domain-containing protein [Gemmatimonadales bacterium]